jgi:hypothetical protein
MLGRNNPQLTQFGINPVKPRTTTAQQMVAAAAKREVTRAKRNTMGSVQKEDVKAIQTPDVSLSSNGKISITPLAADAATTPSVGNITGGEAAPSASAPAAAGSTASTQSTGATGTAGGGTTGSTPAAS